jgi:hypothetical protein
MYAVPRFRILFLLVISIMLLSGAPLKAKEIYFPSLKSGSISTSDDDGSATKLTSQQLAAVSRWLQGHKEGWRRKWKKSPESRATLTLTHADGEKTILFFYAADWNSPIELERRAPHDVFKFRQVASFPVDEIDELRSAARD